MVVEKVQLTIITRMSDDPIYTHDDDDAEFPKVYYLIDCTFS